MAMDYASDLGLAAIWGRVQALAAALRESLAAVPGVRVCDGGVERCGIVTFQVDGHPAEAVKASLARAGINVSVASGSGNLVWFQRHGYYALVRASVHYFNTEAELQQLVAAVERLR